MKKKIIILISCLSVSGISYFSWKVIQQDEQENCWILKQKLFFDNNQKDNSLFWILPIVIFVFLLIAGIVLVIQKKNENSKEKNLDENLEANDLTSISNLKEFFPRSDIRKKGRKEKTKEEKNKKASVNSSVTEINLNNQTNLNNPGISKMGYKPNNNLNNFKNNLSNSQNNSIPNNILDNSIKDPNPKIKIDHRYDSWQCGVDIGRNAKKIQIEVRLFLCQTWNPEEFIKQIFEHDFKNYSNDKNLKKIYNDANTTNKQKIMDFISACLNLLKYINASFLNNIIIKDAYHCWTFRQMAFKFDERKNKYNKRIFLEREEVVYPKVEESYEATKNEDYKELFNEGDSWKLLRQILKLRKHLVHSHIYVIHGVVRDYKHIVTENLFLYCLHFYNLIYSIKDDFKTLFEKHNNKYEIVNENDVALINDDIKKIEAFFEEENEENKNK